MKVIESHIKVVYTPKNNKNRGVWKNKLTSLMKSHMKTGNRIIFEAIELARWDKTIR
jgi:hypothetical protein